MADDNVSAAFRMPARQTELCREMKPRGKVAKKGMEKSLAILATLATLLRAGRKSHRFSSLWHGGILLRFGLRGETARTDRAEIPSAG
jgi:hypothetical protein